MAMRILFLLSLLASTVCLAQTPTVCPWFSTGSAVVVLGGPVLVTAKADSNSEGTCRFTRQNQSLEITIGKTDTHPCPQGSARLIALGNEAVECTSANTPNQRMDIIAGRMRDVYFLVEIDNSPSVATAPSSSANPSDQYAPSILERVAEQVVGSLY